MHNMPNVRKYVKAVVHQIKCYNIVKRLQRIETYIKEFGFDEVTAGDIEKIDSQMTAIMLKAENDLVPSNTKYAFSEELLLQMRKVRLIKTLLNQHENHYPLESYVDATMEKEAAELMQLSAQDLDTHLTESRELLISMQDESWVIRESHHMTRMQAAAENENKDVKPK